MKKFNFHRISLKRIQRASHQARNAQHAALSQLQVNGSPGYY